MKYYEILDGEFWHTGQTKKVKYVYKNSDAVHVFKIIFLISMAFLFWYLAGLPNMEHRWAVNLVGLGFALWSYYVVYKNGYHRKKPSNHHEPRPKFINYRPSSNETGWNPTTL